MPIKVKPNAYIMRSIDKAERDGVNKDDLLTEIINQQWGEPGKEWVETVYKMSVVIVGKHFYQYIKEHDMVDRYNVIRDGAPRKVRATLKKDAFQYLLDSNMIYGFKECGDWVYRVTK